MDNKQPHRYDELAGKWQDGTLTPAEAQEYAAWFNEDDGVPLVIPASFADSETTLRNRILSHIQGHKTPVVPLWKIRVRSVSIAAALILLVAGGYWFYVQRVQSERKKAIAAALSKKDIAPGHNGAVLQLSDGSTIVLDNADNGAIATQGNVKVIKENGEVKYVGKTNEVIYNHITTANGRQWRLTLPDGTKVWLNAASSITYPLSFIGKERVVEITGEAYFEVTHNAKQPFSVKTGSQVIEDIGTAFNVNAYDDESAIKTTLVEGAVNVNGHPLKPGQQSTCTADGSVKVSSDASTEEAVAWKEGRFQFEGADLQAVMRQVARWYNVKIIYEGSPRPHAFSGKISRDAIITDLFNIMTYTTGAHFIISEQPGNGKPGKIVVTP